MTFGFFLDFVLAITLVSIASPDQDWAMNL
jgi:hypothetical protein